MNPRARPVLLVRLAVCDLWHDRKVAFCMITSLVAVIAPLLLLFGLKHGVVTQLQDALRHDPRNLEIKMLGSGHFDDAWLATLRARPEAGFVMGLTRSLNTQADLTAGGQHFIENAEIIPSDVGDPVLGDAARTLPYTHVVLSGPAARRLNVGPGDSFKLRVNRRLDGVAERGELTMQVAAVLDAARFGRPAAFVAPALLTDLERFRDGYQVTALGIATGADASAHTPRYARARIYAGDIDHVGSLERWLNGLRLETSSRLADIDNVRAINRVLELIFGVIAATALLGCVASLAGAFLTNIERKRKDLAVLRLLGFTDAAVAGYVVLQAIVLTAFAYLVGLLLYAAGSAFFNRVLGDSQATDTFVCQITVWHGLFALVLTLGVATAVAAIGAVRAITIEPAESLRDI